MKKEQEKLLQNISNRLGKLTSIRWNFMMSLLQGVATALGATVVAAVVLTLLGWFLERANEVPILDTVIERSGVERSLEQDFSHNN